MLRDVVATTDVLLRVEEGAWSNDLGPYAWVTTPDGGGTQVHVQLDDVAERITSVASQVQEVVIEELWARASNWPMCPAHRNNHPMEARVVDGVATWICPADGKIVTQIDTLRL